MSYNRSSYPKVFCKKGVLRNFTKFTAQVFSCEFCEISKNAFFYRTPLVAASDINRYCKQVFSNFMQESLQTNTLHLNFKNKN